MTGRGLGYCGGSQASTSAQPGFGAGRGFGRGRGFAGGGRGGRGRRHMFRATGAPGWMRGGLVAGAPAGEKQWLETRAQALEAELAAIREQITELCRTVDDGKAGGRE
jgi:hypothetical protein